MLGILISLASALSWGAGDFSGGLAARKNHPFQVLFTATISSSFLMIVSAWIRGETIPQPGDLVLALAAGVCGSLGLAALFRGLSTGNAAVVSPVAGVVGAVLPTVIGVLVEGLPGPRMLIGFIGSILGIWLVTRPDKGKSQSGQQGIKLALAAGVGFGGFLALIAQLDGEGIFLPLVISKFASLGVSAMLIRFRQLPYPNPARSPIALLSGLLDAGGNIFYLLSTQFVRLDVAAMLSSLYPAGTVLLSGWILKEKPSKLQWLGVATCLAGILLISSS